MSPLGGASLVLPLSPSPFLQAGGAWTPASKSGLLLWLKSTSIVGLSDGDPFVSCPDLSSYANTMTVMAGAPTYQTNVVNGKPSVRASAFNVMIGSTTPLALSGAQARSIFVVGNFGGGIIFDAANTAGVPDLAYAFQHDVLLRWGGPFDVTFSTPFPNSVMSFKELVDDGAGTLNTWGDASPLTVNQSIALSATSANGYMMFNWANGDRAGIGDWLETFVYDSATTPTERMNAEAYISAEYALF